MNIVGLTGGMGTGKTSILNLFKKKNINCFNSDFIAKNLMDNDLKEEIKIHSYYILLKREFYF